MIRFEADRDKCRAAIEVLAEPDKMRHNAMVLEALGFETLNTKRGPRWKSAPGERWSSRPTPLWDAKDAFYVAKCAGFDLHSVDRITITRKTMSEGENVRGYLVRMGWQGNPHAGAAAGQAADFEVAFTLAMLKQAAR